VSAGANTLSLDNWLGGMRYRLSLTLVDAAGNRSAPVSVRMTIRR
jgi:hypothetical protein